MLSIVVLVPLLGGPAPLLGNRPAHAAGAPTEPAHEDYYYPKVTSTELYVSRAKVLDDSTKQRRQGFIVGLAEQLNQLPYPPVYSIFAKGDEADKLIIMGMQDGMLNSIYRARALFAQMTSVARGTPLFHDMAVDDLFTFFDLLRLLGFTRVTVSDGKNFTHQVTLK